MLLGSTGKLEQFLWKEENSMTTETKDILSKALNLPPAEKAHLVDCLLSSLDKPDEAVDALWKKEVEERIQAHQSGEMQSVSLEQVLAKYQKG